MIKSFKDKSTEDIFLGINSKEARKIPKEIHGVASRKLDMIDYASKLIDLRIPPGNHLEALDGKLKGKHSIRINDQWRIVFIWKEDGAMEVQITDYH